MVQNSSSVSIRRPTDISNDRTNDQSFRSCPGKHSSVGWTSWIRCSRFSFDSDLLDESQRFSTIRRVIRKLFNSNFHHRFFANWMNDCVNIHSTRMLLIFCRRTNARKISSWTSPMNKWDSKASASRLCWESIRIGLQSVVCDDRDLYSVGEHRFDSSSLSSLVSSGRTQICIDHGFLLLPLDAFHRWSSPSSSAISVTEDFLLSVSRSIERVPRFCYRLYYCLKEYEEEILIQYNPISHHILQVNTSYTIFSTM